MVEVIEHVLGGQMMIEARVLRRSSRYGNRCYDDDDGDVRTSPFLLGNFVFARNYNFSFIIHFAEVRRG